MRDAALLVVMMLLGCGSEAQPDSVTEEIEAPTEAVADEVRGDAPRQPASSTPPSTEPSPEDLLTEEERCALEGASADCLVRLAEEVEADDPEHARSLFEQACFDGSTDACDRLGH